MPKKNKKPAPKISAAHKSYGKNKTPAKTEGIKKIKIRVIGIGGGGGAIVSEIAFRMPKATFVAANTDLQALKTSGRRVSRFQFGENLTQGLGTGMNAELAREAASQEKDRIKKLLAGQDLIVLVASLGGGAGSGAAPVFAKISQNFGNLTYGIFTLPFKFEGEKKMEIAKDSLKKIKNYLNTLSIIPNERVFQIIDKETPLKQALSIINRNLAASLGGLIETLYRPGLINIDFADFRTVLEGRSRFVYLNTVEVQRKENSVKDLIGDVLNSPLYPYTIRGAKGVLFNIAGEKNLSLSEVNQISKTISELSHPEAKIIFGISQSPQYSQTLKITLLANGCGMKIFPAEAKKKKIKKSASPADVATRHKGKKPAQEIPAVEERSSSSQPEKKELKEIKKTRSNPVKIRTAQKSKKEPLLKLETKTEKKESPRFAAPGGERKLAAGALSQARRASIQNSVEETIRKNGLQIKKEIEEIEREMLEREKFWDTPTFLRKKLAKEE